MSRKFKAFFRPKLGDLQKKKRFSPKFRVIFRPKSEIQRFFPPKIRCSPKKNKNKKKRSSPKLSLKFRPISQFQTFEGGLFSNRGAIFHFSHRISLKSTKNMRFCILHKPMGGVEPPPAPPPLATLLNTSKLTTIFELSSKTTKRNILSTFVFKNYGKFTNNSLEKLCPWSLASTIPVLGLERVLPQKVGPWPWVFLSLWPWPRSCVFDSTSGSHRCKTTKFGTNVFCFISY